jgi:hypothetical protein
MSCLANGKDVSKRRDNAALRDFTSKRVGK